jgi:hypothetical protein
MLPCTNNTDYNFWKCKRKYRPILLGFRAFDNTVYYARAEDRDDRKASFISLLEISAIDTVTAECLTEVRLASDSQLLMTAEWRKAKFELVDTTFLSDLDF